MLQITQKDIDNGCIPVDCDFAKEIGFTSDKFKGYLWKDGNTVYLSLIISLKPGKGNVRRLIDRIKDLDYDIICAPGERMTTICKAAGFVQEDDIFAYRQKQKIYEVGIMCFYLRNDYKRMRVKCFFDKRLAEEYEKKLFAWHQKMLRLIKILPENVTYLIEKYDLDFYSNNSNIHDFFDKFKLRLGIYASNDYGYLSLNCRYSRVYFVKYEISEDSSVDPIEID